jgi:hypothetical protein
LLVGALEVLRETRPAKLSLAGVTDFEGGLKVRLTDEIVPAPDCCAERGVERPESWGVGVGRKEGNAAGGFAAGLLGADQSRPDKSSIAVEGWDRLEEAVNVCHVMRGSVKRVLCLAQSLESRQVMCEVVLARLGTRHTSATS